jgi:hypothetical protein
MNVFNGKCYSSLPLPFQRISITISYFELHQYSSDQKQHECCEDYGIMVDRLEQRLHPLIYRVVQIFMHTPFDLIERGIS